MAPVKLATLFYILICLSPIVLGWGCKCSNGICQRCFPCLPIGITITTNEPLTNLKTTDANIMVQPEKLTPIPHKENPSSLSIESINNFANGHMGLLMTIFICQVLILIMQCRYQKPKLSERMETEGQLTNNFTEKPGAITLFTPEELQFI